MFDELEPKQVNSDQMTLIDVREPEEFYGELGHIKTAESIPLGELIKHLDILDKNKSYLLICRSGRRSFEAMKLMSAAGFKQIHNLKGGMLAWNRYWNKES